MQLIFCQECLQGWAIHFEAWRSQARQLMQLAKLGTHQQEADEPQLRRKRSAQHVQEAKQRHAQQNKNHSINTSSNHVANA